MNETNNKPLTADEILSAIILHDYEHVPKNHRKDFELNMYCPNRTTALNAMREYAQQEVSREMAALKEENERLKDRIVKIGMDVTYLQNQKLRQQLSTMVEALETARKLILGGNVAFTSEDEKLYNEKVLPVIKAYRQSKEKGAGG